MSGSRLDGLLDLVKEEVVFLLAQNLEHGSSHLRLVARVPRNEVLHVGVTASRALHVFYQHYGLRYWYNLSEALTPFRITFLPSPSTMSVPWTFRHCLGAGGAISGKYRKATDSLELERFLAWSNYSTQSGQEV